jgi:hypothetical protein
VTKNAKITIPSVALEFDDAGGAVLTQDHHDGNGEQWVELHPVHLQALMERAPRSSAVTRLCSIANRMIQLQEQLCDLDLQPYAQPYALGRVILDDLESLLKDFGLEPMPATPKENPSETHGEPNRNPAVFGAKPVGSAQRDLLEVTQ